MGFPAATPVCRGGRSLWQAFPASPGEVAFPASPRWRGGVRGLHRAPHRQRHRSGRAACAGQRAARANQSEPMRLRSRARQVPSAPQMMPPCRVPVQNPCRTADRVGTPNARVRPRDDAAAKHRGHPPSGWRKTGHAASSNNRASHAEETRSSSALQRTASASGTALAGTCAFTTVKSRCIACIRHSPPGVETSNASPGAVAAKPCRRAHAAVRPKASSSRSASRSMTIQSCPRPMIGARKRNRLPVPAPRSSRRGRLGSRSANRRASATLRAAWSNGSRSASQSASKCSVTRPGPEQIPSPASASSAGSDQPETRLLQRRDAALHRR